MIVSNSAQILYISEFEREVLCLAHSKVSFLNIAGRYDIEVGDVHQIYHEALKKAKLLIGNEKAELIVYPFLCKDIENFIKRMGLSAITIRKQNILKVALSIGNEYPDKLNNLMTQFYPVIAKEFRVSVNYIRRVLKDIFETSHKQMNSESKIFFSRVGVYRVKEVRMSKLLKASIKCIEW